MSSSLKTKIIALALAGLCVLLGLAVAGAQLHYLAQRRELFAIEDRVAQTARDTTRLTGELERMRQPSWLALLARQRLGYKLPDETVVFVYKSEKSDTIGQPQPASDVRPNWRKWWDWVRGN